MGPEMNRTVSEPVREWLCELLVLVSITWGGLATPPIYMSLS